MVPGGDGYHVLALAGWLIALTCVQAKKNPGYTLRDRMCHPGEFKDSARLFL